MTEKKINRCNPRHLKIKDVIYLFDPVVDIVIWTQEDTEEPSYEGSMLNMPWYYLDYELGSYDPHDDEPISVRHDLGNGREGIVFQAIAK